MIRRSFMIRLATLDVPSDQLDLLSRRRQSRRVGSSALQVIRKELGYNATTALEVTTLHQGTYKATET